MPRVWSPWNSTVRSPIRASVGSPGGGVQGKTWPGARHAAYSSRVSFAKPVPVQLTRWMPLSEWKQSFAPKSSGLWALPAGSCS